MCSTAGPMPSSVDDAYLVGRAVDGYVDAFEMLVDRHTTPVFRVALRITGDRGDAQDITQETFLAAWQSLSRFRGDSLFSTWRFQIVTRRALNYVTRGRTRNATDLLADVPDGAGRDARHDPDRDGLPAVDAVTEAVSKLPLPQRIAVVLHHFERLSYTEVATVTRSTVPAVRSHLFRARRTLAEQLKEWGLPRDDPGDRRDRRRARPFPDPPVRRGHRRAPGTSRRGSRR